MTGLSEDYAEASSELLMVGIAPIRGQIHRTTYPLRRPGWAVTACGIRKRLVPAEWRKPEDVPTVSRRPTMDEPMGYIDIVFDGPPGPEPGRFVEVEDESGHSIAPGTWVQRADGYWVLRLPWEAEFWRGVRDADGPKLADRIRFRSALERIAACPNPDSVEDCHDQMSDIARRVLNQVRTDAKEEAGS